MKVGDRVVYQVRGRMNYDCRCEVTKFIPRQGVEIAGFDRGGFPISWVVAENDPSVRPAVVVIPETSTQHNQATTKASCLANHTESRLRTAKIQMA